MAGDHLPQRAEGARSHAGAALPPHLVVASELSAYLVDTVSRSFCLHTDTIKLGCAWNWRRMRPTTIAGRLIDAPSHAQAFSGLKALYLESNAISLIEGLDHMRELRSLYLSKNMIRDASGLSSIPWLKTLDLSHNNICSLDGLESLTELSTLNVSHNKISSAADLEPLRHCTALDTLDLGNNKVQGEDALLVLEALPVLLLRLVGNPVVSSTSCAPVAAGHSWWCHGCVADPPRLTGHVGETERLHHGVHADTIASAFLCPCRGSRTWTTCPALIATAAWLPLSWPVALKQRGLSEQRLRRRQMPGARRTAAISSRWWRTPRRRRAATRRPPQTRCASVLSSVVWLSAAAAYAVPFWAATLLKSGRGTDQACCCLTDANELSRDADVSEAEEDGIAAPRSVADSIADENLPLRLNSGELTVAPIFLDGMPACGNSTEPPELAPAPSGAEADGATAGAQEQPGPASAADSGGEADDAATGTQAQPARVSATESGAATEGRVRSDGTEVPPALGPVEECTAANPALTVPEAAFAQAWEEAALAAGLTPSSGTGAAASEAAAAGTSAPVESEGQLPGVTRSAALTQALAQRDQRRRQSGSRRTAVWNTPEYQDLWQLAVNVGASQEPVAPEPSGDVAGPRAPAGDDASVTAEVSGDLISAGHEALDGGLDLGGDNAALEESALLVPAAEQGSELDSGSGCLAVQSFPLPATSVPAPQTGDVLGSEESQSVSPSAEVRDGIDSEGSNTESDEEGEDGDKDPMARYAIETVAGSSG